MKNLKEKNKRSRRLKKRRRLILRIILSLIVIVVIALGGFYLYVRQNIKVGTTENNIESDKGTQYQEQDGINNILLIGVDSRKKNERTRSDSMIIMTIDNNKKKLKLTSIMRDIYVPIEGHYPQKINAANSLGSTELLLKTIKQNFKIAINKYIIIDFKGFEQLIDAVDGIEVDVKDYEIQELNKYTGEATGGRKSPLITKAGMQKLDGQQALSYARIRKIGNGCYERDSRQRKVISLLAEKLKDISIINYPKLLNTLLPMVKTNIEPIMLMNYGYTLSKFKPLEIEQLQIPQNEISAEKTYRVMMEGEYKKQWVQLIDREQNAKVLNDFIFKDKAPNKNEYDMDKFKSVIDEYLRNEPGATNNNVKKSNLNHTENKYEEDKNSSQNNSNKTTQNRYSRNRNTQKSETQEQYSKNNKQENNKVEENSKQSNESNKTTVKPSSKENTKEENDSQKNENN